MARIGHLSTYPPTRCGLATFAAALSASLAHDTMDEHVVVRVDDLVPTGPADARGPVQVVADLHPGDPAGRAWAVEVFNGCDVVIVQHEYGIYGGPDGDEIVDILARLRRPAIVVLHTVLASPSWYQRLVTQRIAHFAAAVVAMTETARRILIEEYDIPPTAIRLIPHGADVRRPAAKTPAPPRPVILTWGLIGPGKGIEWGIRAMAKLTDLHPRPIYRVLGQTHPKVLREQGEQYRMSLLALADELGVADDIEIDGRYQGDDELADSIASASVVLLPYDSREQATSGVLAEAVAAEKAVIATRFPHAVELLSGGRGTTIDHESPRAVEKAVRTALKAGTHRAPAVAGSIVPAIVSWPAVAEQYRALAVELTSNVVPS